MKMSIRNKDMKYLLGLDFGTESVRVYIVNQEGEEISSYVHEYSRFAEGLFCDAKEKRFRQHPLDYQEGLELAVKKALREAAAKEHDRNIGQKVVGIGVDTTGSTPCPVDINGTPLALSTDFKDDPNAMFHLWKDHTATEEAALINDVAHGKTDKWKGIDYTSFSGTVYSSEWFWSKILHTLKHSDQGFRDAAYSWVEHCDWITRMLTGNTKPETMMRGRTASGHKAMWNELWQGLPSEEFLVAVDPLLAGLRQRLYTDTYTSDKPVGKLSPEWAQKLGLNEDAVVAVGSFDAHMGAVGAGIKKGTLVKIMGTSTCDMMIAPYDLMRPQGQETLIEGICGQVDGSITPGYIGLEAGQSAVGDVFAWFRNLLIEGARIGLREEGIRRLGKQRLENLKTAIYQEMARKGKKLDVMDSAIPLVLDWLNGRRTPYANQELTGAMWNVALGTDAPRFFRGLVEGTAYGSKMIVDQFKRYDLSVEEVNACGGLSRIPYVAQITSDVMGVPIRVARSGQTCALGATMFAAVAAGLYPDIQTAQRRMSSGFLRTYRPNMDNHALYTQLFEQYKEGGRSLEPLMLTMNKLRRTA